MTTTTLRPTGESTPGTHWAIGGSSPAATRWESVDEAVADDGTTTIVVSTPAQAGYITDVSFAASGLHPLTVINSVTAYWRGQRVGAGTPDNTDLRVNGTVVVNDHDFGADYAYHDKSHAMAAVPGGGAWTVADVDAITVGAGPSNHASGAGNQITQIYIVVDYDVLPEAPEAAGGWW